MTQAETQIRDLDREREVLGSVLIKPELMTELGLVADDFGALRHRLIWQAMERVVAGGAQLDIASVWLEIKAAGDDRRVRVQDIGEALDRHGFSWNAAHYAKQIRRQALMRAIDGERAMLGRVLREGDDGTASIDAICAHHDRLLAIDAGQADPWLDEVIAAVDAAMEPRSFEVVPIGLGPIDEHLGGGLEPGWLAVVLGAAKSGKSALALNNCARGAAQMKKRVLVVSLEMSARDCIRRWLAAESGVPVRAQRRADLTDAQKVSLTDAGDVIGDWSMRVIESARTVDDIAAIARQHKRDAGLDLLVVDYAQLLDNGAETMAIDIAKTTRGLKLLAGELKCAVVLLSQPNNADAKSGQLNLFSGKGSGSIAADCDLMLIPTRDEDDPDRVGMFLAGFRHGAPHRWANGSFEFDGARLMFVDPATARKV